MTEYETDKNNIPQAGRVGAQSQAAPARAVAYASDAARLTRGAHGVMRPILFAFHVPRVAQTVAEKI